MWRPFAGSFVEHSLDSFINKHERGKSNLIYTPKPPREVSRFQLSPKDIETRFNSFKKLKEKVALQRAEIKRKDSLYQHKVELSLRYKRKPKFLFAEENRRLKSLVVKKKSEGLETEQDNRQGKMDLSSAGGSKMLPLPLLKRKSS